MSELTSPQRSLMESKAHEILFYGARGSGRTFGAIQWASAEPHDESFLFMTAGRFNGMRLERFGPASGWRIVIDNAEQIDSEQKYLEFRQLTKRSRIVLTASPNGKAHAWLTERFFTNPATGRVAIFSGRMWDNSYLDVDFRRLLAQAMPSDASWGGGA